MLVSLPTSELGGPPTLSSDLDQDLHRFAASRLPRQKDVTRRTKEWMWRHVEQVAREVLGPDSRVFPFGSSVNGFGEALSDLDLVLYCQPSPDAPRGTAKSVLRSLVKALRKMSMGGGRVQVDTVKLSAKVPVLTLNSPDGLYSCDVTYLNIMPLYNSQLLRAYVELEPFLQALVIAVKAWAKAEGMAKTHGGFLSSYAWTLMAIYFYQVVHGLPSLHVAARVKRKLPVLWCPAAYEVSYQKTTEQARLAKGGSRPTAGQLLFEFFEFYSERFDWESEVVSVRLGQRAGASDEAAFRPELFGLAFGTSQAPDCNSPRLHIEDPIDCRRNLNFALSGRTVQELKHAIKRAYRMLRDGSKLAMLLGVKHIPDAEPLASGPKAHLGGFLRPPSSPEVEGLVCECEVCGAQMGHRRLLDHALGCRDLVVDSNEGEFGCQACGKFFQHLHSLEDHQRVKGHVGRTTHQDAAAQWDQLLASLRGHTEPKAKEALAVRAKRRLSGAPPQSSAPAAAVQTVRKQKPWTCVCSTCPKVFQTLEDLAAHKLAGCPTPWDITDTVREEDTTPLAGLTMGQEA